MAYIHKLRHRKLHKLRDETGDLVVREPQKPNTISKGNPKPSVSSDPVTDVVVSDPVSNVVSVVLVTATATFTGDVAGYITPPPFVPQPTPEQAFTYVTEPPQNIQPSSIDYGWVPGSSWASVPVETSAQAPAATNFGAVPAVASSAVSNAESRVDAPSGAPSSDLPTSIAFAVSSSGIVSSYVPSRTASRSLATASSSSTATAEAAASSGGMTAGGKVGLAIGIILIIALVAGGGLWFYWKKKKENEWQKPDDEKTGFGVVGGGAMAMKSQSEKPFGSAATTANKHDSNAPRLSLRPVTQFIPDLAAKQLNPQNNANNPSGMAAAGAARNLTPGNPTGSAWERRPGGEAAANPFKDPVNPFVDQARSGPAPPNVTVTPPMSDDGSSVNNVTAVAAGAAVGVAGAALAAGAGKHSPPAKNRPGSPQGGAGAAGGPPGNVYRVQLDFIPSMEDELELCAGQLVRVLHEYDDGWVC
jgi:hypothetical protein